MIQKWININLKNKIKIDLYLWDLDNVITEYDKWEDLNIRNNINLKNNSVLFDFIKSFIKQKWIENILMNYEYSIDWRDFSSHNYEQYILWLTSLENLKDRDKRRYFTWSVPFANYIFNTFLNIDATFPELKTEILSEENPLISKYNDISKDDNLNNLEKKFKFITEYINEVSHSVDAAWIWWMSWATDFLQLYKYIMMEDIIKKEDRKQIIEQLFKILKYDEKNYKDDESFWENYKEFIELLKKKNTNNDTRLSRLYNRLYFIFSFVLNNQKPKEFPIYFSATRNTLRFFWVDLYENVIKIYKEFLLDKEIESYIKKYLERINISDKNYLKELKNITSFDEDLFTSHAKYRFFQDLCWVLNRNVLDGQDFVNNNYKVWDTFNINELNNKKYFGDINVWNIINKKYLIDEWYIKEISSWEYEVIKTDYYYIWKTKHQQ